MLQQIYGRAGYGKSEYIYSVIAEKIKDGITDIYLIVPDQQTVITEREIVRRFGNKINMHLEVINFKRMPNRVAKKLGNMAYDYIDDTVKKLIMRRSVKSIEQNLKVYEKNASSFEFYVKMTSVINEFKMYLITPRDCENVIAKLGGDNAYLINKLEDLTLIYSVYNNQLETDLRDISDDYTFLFRLLGNKTGEGNYFFDNATVIFDSFDSFSPGQKLVIKRIMSQARDIYITHKVDPDYTMEEKNIFSSCLETDKFIKDYGAEIGLERRPPVVLTEQKRFNNAALAVFERNLWSRHISAPADSAGMIEIFECANQNEEIECVVKKILNLVRVNGVRYREIQVIARDMTAYHGIIDVIFQKYGVPLFISTPTLFITKPVTTFILSLFDIIIYNFRYANIVSYLKTGFSDLTSDEIDAYEIYANTWNINGIHRYVGDRYWNMHPDGYQEISDEDIDIIEYLADINRIKNKIAEPVINMKIRLDELKDDEGRLITRDILNVLFDFLTELNIYEKLTALYNEKNKDGERAEAEELTQVWNILMGIFEKIALVCGNDRVDIKEFKEILEFITNEQEIGSIPTSIDEVIAENAQNMRNIGIKYTFLLGMNDNVFPADISGTDIFNDKEKAVLHNNGIDYSVDSMQKMYNELLYFYNTVTSMSDYLCFTYSVRKITGEELFPSYLLNQVRELFPDLNIKKYSDNIELTLEGSKTAVENYYMVDDINLKEAFLNYFKLKDIDLKDGRIKETNINISKEITKALMKNLSLSSTSLETFSKCHFSFFLKYVLKLKMPVKTSFHNTEAGNFIHKILEMYFERILTENNGFKNVDNIRQTVNDLINNYLRKVMKDYDEKSERFKYQFTRLEKTLTALIESLHDEFMNSDFEPKKVELKINDEYSSIQPLNIKLEDGGNLKIYGKVDRVDVYKEGNNIYVRIIDYKSGIQTFNLSDILMGLNMQMLIYLFNILKNGGKILADGKDDILNSAGILYQSSDVPVYDIFGDDVKEKKGAVFSRSGLFTDDKRILKAVRHDLEERYDSVKSKDGLQIKYDNTVAVLASKEKFEKLENYINDTLNKIAESISNGNADINPIKKDDEYESCRFCEYKYICRKESGDPAGRIYTSKKISEVWEQI